MMGHSGRIAFLAQYDQSASMKNFSHVSIAFTIVCRSEQSESFLLSCFTKKLIYIAIMSKKTKNSYILEPYFTVFEQSHDCRLTIHDYVNFLFIDGRSPFNHHLRSSHRRTFPEQCGKELRQYCISHCMDNLNERIARTQRDCYFKHCRNNFWEVVAPVYRNGFCVLVIFAGLFNPRQDREKMRRISLLLPLFARGICKIAEETRERAIFGDSLENRIHAFVQDNFNRPVSTRDIAEHLSLSISRVCHLIKVHCGKSFIDILTEERIHNAKLFLKQSDFRIKEIAGLCGFRNPEHFIRVFHARTGTTPGGFRLDK